MNCRNCQTPLVLPFLDLGTAPPSNAYLTGSQLMSLETFYPLRILLCRQCWLVQTEDYAAETELFSPDYAYFSSISSTWLAHAQNYALAMRERFGLSGQSRVVEVAANDGYLLQYFRKAGIPCYGIEPTASTAHAARERGIEIIQEFFGVRLAGTLVAAGRQADLMVANNVLAHVPDINDFVSGFAALLKPAGVATFEFPHLLNLIEKCQFDTVYHEHYSYLSLIAVKSIFERNGLEIFDVETIPTHGGSLRLFAQKSETGTQAIQPAVQALLETEERAGLRCESFYAGFQAKAESVKNEFLAFLLAARRDGKVVVAYGAAAKGNTLLNFAGVRHDLLPYIVDRNPAKQGKFAPGSHIPIVGEERLWRDRPDYLLILPWNISEEITAQLAGIGEWGGQFVVAIPKLEIR